MGTPQFAVPLLDALTENPVIQLTAVFTPPDRKRGRGQELAPSPVKRRAVELGLPVEQPATFRNAQAVDQLAAHAPDIIVVAAYGRLLPAEVLDMPRFGCLNLHPSLLPRHRGPSPVAGAILAGDDTTGVTVMLLDEGMDTGPIVSQSSRSICAEDDAETLTANLFRDGADLLNDVIPDWVAGTIEAVPQDDERATYTKKMERGDGLADWALEAETLCRQQRAFTPWPGLYTSWDGKEIKLLEVAQSPGEDAPPGLVVSTEVEPLLVGTGGGLLAVRRLQLEGRRPAEAADFVRGHPQFIGAMLG
jgi:methionyl-tRNA formyltransferase